MYLCNRCKTDFESPAVLTTSYGLPGGMEAESDIVCPHCGSDDWEEARVCTKCGKLLPESQSLFGLCKECEDEADIVWNAAAKFLQASLTEKQLAYLDWRSLPLAVL